MSNVNYSLDFELNDNNFLSNLFGINDINIQIIEKINNVKIKYRGNKIKIIGSKISIKDTKEEILLLFEEAKKGVNIDEDKIMETRSLKLLDISSDEQMNLFFQTKKEKFYHVLKIKKIIFNYLIQKILFLHMGQLVQVKPF